MAGLQPKGMCMIGNELRESGCANFVFRYKQRVRADTLS